MVSKKRCLWQASLMHLDRRILNLMRLPMVSSVSNVFVVLVSKRSTKIQHFWTQHARTMPKYTDMLAMNLLVSLSTTPGILGIKALLVIIDCFMKIIYTTFIQKDLLDHILAWFKLLVVTFYLRLRSLITDGQTSCLDVVDIFSIDSFLQWRCSSHISRSSLSLQLECWECH